MLNDPYAAGGNHLPDWVIARPVFADGALLAFACNRAHQSDIGGGAAGTYNPQATEIFHEGLRLPVMTLVEAGRVREDLWALLKLNCPHAGSPRRRPARHAGLDPDRGRAHRGARHGARGGARPRRLRRHTRLRPRALPRRDRRPAGRRLPREDRSDTDCFGEADIRTRVTLTVSGEELVVDFTGTDPQIAGFKNSSLANTHSAVYTALYSFFEADLPRNEGSFRSVRIVAPEGTHINARAPAPMTMCTVFPAHDIIHAVWKALAQAVPSRACAGWARNVFGVTAGRAEGASEPFVMYHNNLAAGGGAIPGRDGFRADRAPVHAGRPLDPRSRGVRAHLPGALPAPGIPLRFRRRGRLPRGDGGGLRPSRCGCPPRYSFRGEGLRTPSGYGVDGGGYGAAGSMRLYPADGAAPIEAPQYGLMDLPALRYEASSPGGGGVGEPRERDPARVLADVRDRQGEPGGRAEGDLQWR